MGVIGDRVNRPQLLALGVTAWSVLATVAGRATNFGDLMLARVGLATAQSAQNVVSFSMVPDLFPNNKATGGDPLHPIPLCSCICKLLEAGC